MTLFFDENASFIFYGPSNFFRIFQSKKIIQIITYVRKKNFNQNIKKNFFSNIGCFIYQNVQNQILINFQNGSWSP